MAWSVLTWKILRIFQSRFLSGRFVPGHATAHIQTRWQQAQKNSVLNLKLGL
jgi:hypothetical protein